MKTIVLEVKDLREEMIVKDMATKYGIGIVSLPETQTGLVNKVKVRQKSKVPNAITRRAIEDVRAGKGLTEVKDVSELFEKILK